MVNFAIEVLRVFGVLVALALVIGIALAVGGWILERFGKRAFDAYYGAWVLLIISILVVAIQY